MHYFNLGPSRTHAERACCLAPVRSDWCEAYLIIRMGTVGPKGGRSKYSVDGYFLQETEFPPEDRRPGWREFLLAHDHNDRPDVYCVTVPPRGVVGCCTCEGFNYAKTCKHIDALCHLCYVIGWRSEAADVAPDLEHELFGPDPVGVG